MISPVIEMCAQYYHGLSSTKASMLSENILKNAWYLFLKTLCLKPTVHFKT